MPLALLSSLMLFGLQVWWSSPLCIDDVFITFRYVRQWTHGNGLVYNVGDWVEGYSNLLWVVLLAPLDLLHVDLLSGARTLGVTCGVLTLAVTVWFARRLEYPWISGLLLATFTGYVAWSESGLETPLFCLLVSASLFSFVYEEERGRGWTSGVLFGLTALTRPEGLLFAGVAFLMRCIRLYRQQARPQRRDLFRVLAVGIIAGGQLVWRLGTYGVLLPNTIYAKSMGLHLRALLEGLYYFYGSVEAAGGFLVLALLVGMSVLRCDRPFYVECLAVTIATYAAFIVLGGGDWMPMQRFMVHVAPLLVVLLHDGLEQLSRLVVPRWGRAALVLLVCGQTVYGMAGLLELRLVSGGKTSMCGAESAIARYIEQHLIPGEAVAFVDAGLIASQLPLEVRVIDMVGLNDAHIAHLSPQFPGGLWGRGDAYGKWDVDYVLAQDPQFVHVHLQGKDAAGNWQTNFTGTTLLLNDARFRARYRHVPDAQDLNGLFIRRDDLD